jgi:hypothetical protein
VISVEDLQSLEETRRYGSGLLNFAAHSPEDSNATEVPILRASDDRTEEAISVHNGSARASCASGGGGASRVPRIAGDVTAGSALVSCVLVSYAPCAAGAAFDLLRRG